MNPAQTRVTLLAGDASPINGTGTVTHELGLGLLACPDYDPLILIKKTSPQSHASVLEGKVRYVLPRWTPTFRLRPHKLFPILYDSIKLPPIDLIHAVVEFPYAILAERLAREIGVPYIVSVHGTYAVAPFSHWENRLLYRRAIRNAAAVTACSQFVADALREASGIARDVDVISNPVDYDRFQKPTDLKVLRHRLGLPLEGRIIFGAGALKARKGFDVLLRAFARVASEEPGAVLVVAGGGDVKPWESLAASLGIADRACFLGAIKDDDLIGLYQTCELFAHLPRYINMHFEGFGLIYLEAGSCGKAVVGSRSGGVADAVRDGETGLLVHEGDHEAAASAILRLMRDEGLRRSMGAAGRQWALQHDRRYFAKRVMGIYERVLRKEQQKAAS